MASRLSGVFSEIDPPRLANPVLAFLKDYWDKKRGTRALPARADIRPTDMKEYLGWVVLVDALPGFKDFRYRMIGTKVTRYFMEGATGQTISQAFAPNGESVVGAMQAVYRKTARDRAVVHTYGQADWLGRAFLDFDAIYLPLSDDGLTANMVLSAVTFELAGPLKGQRLAGLS